jgi:ubiquinone/menaquinone biosynthesis C-methylase UbiE
LSTGRVEQLVDGVYEAMALLAGMELGVFAELRGGGKDAAQMAAALGVEVRAVQTLLEALVGAGLLHVAGDHFANGEEASRLLLPESPDYIGPRHRLWKTTWPTLLHTADSVRAGTARAEIDFSSASETELEDLIRGLHPGSMRMGRELASTIDWSGCERLLDVGGGSGGASIALCRALPSLRATVVELPSVALLARQIAAEEDMCERVQVTSCNMVEQAPDGVYDAALCKAYFQVLAPDDVPKAMHHIYQVLKPGAWILIVGDMLDDIAEPADLASFSLLFLNAYKSGRLFYQREYSAWLAAAGFVDIERVEQGVLRAKKA